jgi:hypothetical protein
MRIGRSVALCLILIPLLGSFQFGLPQVLPVAESRSAPPQTWFAPIDWIVRKPPGGSSGFVKYDDYMTLFEPKPPAVMNRVNVFALYPQLVALASDDELRSIFAGLKREKMPLALEPGLLTATDRCGHGVEGYGGPNSARLAERIAKLGGDLAYVAMDEPAWYGHNFGGPNACRAPLADIARDVAGNIVAVRAIFPKVEIGDIEPVGSSPGDGLVHEYGEWADAYQQAVGEPLAFFQADVQWANPWVGPVAKLAADLKAKAIPFGIIYNGDGDDTSDQSWVAHAEAHYLTYEADGRLAPDQAVFQSWVAHPSHLFPDTDPGAFSYLLKRYFRSPTQIAAQLTQGMISGRLVDDNGKPVPGAELVGTGMNDAGPGIPSQTSLRGAVPAGARSAVLGLRIDIECECSGTADIGVGPLRYQEAGSGSTEHSFTPGRDGWRDGAGATVNGSPEAMSFQIKTTPDHPILLNSPPFAVIAGADFVLNVPWRVSPSSSGSGYLALIFLDGIGKEIHRSELPLEPDWLPLGRARTDGRGYFSSRFGPSAIDVDLVKLRYDGDNRLRPATVDLRRPQ